MRLLLTVYTLWSVSAMGSPFSEYNGNYSTNDARFERQIEAQLVAKENDVYFQFTSGWRSEFLNKTVRFRCSSDRYCHANFFWVKPGCTIELALIGEVIFFQAIFPSTCYASVRLEKMNSLEVN